MLGLGGDFGSNISSDAKSVSDDGRFIVGSKGTAAFRWSLTTGTEQVGLGTSFDVSEDGSVVVGQSMGAPFRWTESDGAIRLGVSAGRAVVVSSDGTTILGDTSGDNASAWIWTEETGVRDLLSLLRDEYLLARPTDGIDRLTAVGISSDRTMIVATSPRSDDSTGFLISLLPTPHPGDANRDGSVGLDDFGILKTNFGTINFRNEGDFDGNGKVELFDFALLKANFGWKQAAAVPEPSAWILLAMGAICVLAWRLY